ncbi:MAG: adenylate/guanylate cyclase domain-containing protein, partial [Fibrella sp.]|nr:adenylate/guanylate cyclase domain-containing protein [Armatimonadota bacterium]
MAAMPVGTITFLFTDIEGSTRLWDLAPVAMQTALARHDFLMRTAIEANDGYVFKTVGDAFCAAFHTAGDALRAAVLSQQTLQTEVWETPEPIQVRMALHTGTAEIRDNDYFGPPLNRVSRLLATGHGGQVLLSLPAQELVRDMLPEDVSLRGMGLHRLKDLVRPETVYQLCHPRLADTFAPLRSLDNPELPNNLPQQTTSFIGRDKQIEDIKTLLGNVRLLTLTGAGGCGKTRLSLQVAADLLDTFPDGVWFVELAPLSDPELVSQTAASVLGIKQAPGNTMLKSLADALKSKQLLILLDNCEHVLDASARLAEALLKNCPHVRLVASSREGLNIPGETTYRVPSLSLPDPKTAQTIASVSSYEAVQLFLERALASRPDFAVTTANAPAIAQLCTRLDGIPLAIELAAARVNSLSVEEISQRLDQRFRLLT